MKSRQRTRSICRCITVLILDLPDLVVEAMYIPNEALQKRIRLIKFLLQIILHGSACGFACCKLLSSAD